MSDRHKYAITLVFHGTNSEKREVIAQVARIPVAGDYISLPDKVVKVRWVSLQTSGAWDAIVSVDIDVR
jgi:hypothetical protein